MQKSFRLKFVVAIAIFVIILVIALYGYYKFTGRGGNSEYGVNKSKDELMKEYFSYSSMGDNFKAFRSIKAASSKDPDNMTLMKKAADAAIKAGKKSEANQILEKIWGSGVREPKVLFSLVATSILPKFEQRKRTLELIGQIDQESLRQKLYALYYYQLEKYEQAEGYFNWLITNDPHPAIYEYTARNFLALREPVKAIQVLEEAQAKNYLGDGGEIILANLYAIEAEPNKEKTLYTTYTRENGASDFVVLSHAIILFANNELDKAKEYLEKISHPSRFAADNIVSAEDVIDKLKHDPALKLLLNKLSPRTRDVMDADQNDIFELSLFSELIAQDFNRIAAEDSHDSEEFLEELSKIHKYFDAELSELGSNRTAHQARLFLAPILYTQKDKSGLDKLLLFASGNDRFYEGERNLTQYFIDRLEGKSGASEKLVTAEDILGKNVVVLLTQAGYNADIKNYEESIKDYSLAARANKTIGSGRYLLEHLAEVLAADKKYLASFELIRRMHNRHMISKKTLMLLRDVAYPAGFPEISKGAQTVLEKKYGQSDDIMLGKGELNLEEGNAQAALDVFEKLLAKGVEPTYEARVNSVMAEAMLQLAMFNGVLDIVNEKNIDATYKARALYGLGEHDKALELFSEVEGTPVDKGQWRVEYGLLLALKGREEDAAKQFQQAIDDNPKLIRAYVELASILLKHNQYQQAKFIAERALKISPELVRPKIIIANVDIVTGNNASAELMLDDVLNKYPRNIDALFLLSRCQLGQNEADKALDTINLCLQIRPDLPLFLQQKIDILVRLGRLDEAAKITAVGVKTGKANALFEHARVMLFLQQNKPEAAFEALRQAKDIGQNDRLILESQILAAENKTQEAIDKLKPYSSSPKIQFRIVELIIKDPQSTASDDEYVVKGLSKFNFTPRTLMALGIMADEAQKPDMAQLIYKRGLELVPDEKHLLNNYIWASLHSKQVSESDIIAEADKALKLYPEDLMLLDTCTTAYNKFGKFDKTIEVLRKNPVLFRLEPSLYMRLGDAWSGKKVRSEAKKAYLNAEQAERSTPELKKEARKKLENIE